MTRDEAEKLLEELAAAAIYRWSTGSVKAISMYAEKEQACIAAMTRSETTEPMHDSLRVGSNLETGEYREDIASDVLAKYGIPTPLPEPKSCSPGCRTDGRGTFYHADDCRAFPRPLCEDCPPIGYPTDKTRCRECPRRAEIDAQAYSIEITEATPYQVTCARCGKLGSSDEFEIEEGDEWECQECWERCEAEERITCDVAAPHHVEIPANNYYLSRFVELAEKKDK